MFSLVWFGPALYLRGAEPRLFKLLELAGAIFAAGFRIFSADSIRQCEVAQTFPCPEDEKLAGETSGSSVVFPSKR